jgi:hypothetical protein
MLMLDGCVSDDSGCAVLNSICYEAVEETEVVDESVEPCDLRRAELVALVSCLFVCSCMML